MAVKSKRLRFEILKRDKFRCAYCGASAFDAVLHVEHVIPESGGGTDDPANLVTACSDCNLGKSDRGLGESGIKPSRSADEILEHAEQIEAYLAACRELDSARKSGAQYVIEAYESASPSGYVHAGIHDAIPHMLRRYPFELVVEAARIVAAKRGIDDRAPYMWGVLRRLSRGESDPRAPLLAAVDRCVHTLLEVACTRMLARVGEIGPDSSPTPEGSALVSAVCLMESALAGGWKPHPDAYEFVDEIIKDIDRLQRPYNEYVTPAVAWLRAFSEKRGSAA